MNSIKIIVLGVLVFFSTNLLGQLYVGGNVFATHSKKVGLSSFTGITSSNLDFNINIGYFYKSEGLTSSGIGLEYSRIERTYIDEPLNILAKYNKFILMYETVTQHPNNCLFARLAAGYQLNILYYNTYPTNYTNGTLNHGLFTSAGLGTEIENVNFEIGFRLGSDLISTEPYSPPTLSPSLKFMDYGFYFRISSSWEVFYTTLFRRNKNSSFGK